MHRDNDRNHMMRVIAEGCMDRPHKSCHGRHSSRQQQHGEHNLTGDYLWISKPGSQSESRDAGQHPRVVSITQHFDLFHQSTHGGKRNNHSHK